MVNGFYVVVTIRVCWFEPVRRTKKEKKEKGKEKNGPRSENREQSQVGVGIGMGRQGGGGVYHSGLARWFFLVVFFFCGFFVSVYDFKCLNLPVSKANCASLAYASVVLSSDGTEWGFTLISSSLSLCLRSLCWRLNR